VTRFLRRRKNVPPSSWASSTGRIKGREARSGSLRPAYRLARRLARALGGSDLSRFGASFSGSLLVRIPPAFVGGPCAERRVSDVFNSPQRSEDYCDAFDYPARGHPRLGAHGRPAQPADPAPPVEHRKPPGSERRPREPRGP
jgi:hypothetical protein